MSTAASGQPVQVVVNTAGGTAPPPTPPQDERPLGVAILAVLVALFGVGAIALGLLTLANVHVAWLQTYIQWVPNLKGFSGNTAAIVTLVAGIVSLAAAIGLWRLSMVALVLAILILLYEMIVFGLANEFKTVGFIASLVIFLYLIAVSRHFT